LYAQFFAGNLGFPIFRVDMIRVPNDPHMSKLGSNLAQELQTLRGEIGGNQRHTRDVGSGMRKARDEASLNRVIADSHDDWNRIGRDPRRWSYVATEREY